MTRKRRLGATLDIRLVQIDRDRIDEIAATQGKARAAVVREAIALFLSAAA